MQLAQFLVLPSKIAIFSSPRKTTVTTKPFHRLSLEIDIEMADSRLSRDAKIAIGVLIPLTVISIFTAIGFYIYFRRQLAKRLASGKAPVPDAYMLGTLPPK